MDGKLQEVCIPRWRVPTPPHVTLFKGLMVTIRWYLGSLQGELEGAGIAGPFAVCFPFLLHALR